MPRNNFAGSLRQRVAGISKTLALACAAAFSTSTALSETPTIVIDRVAASFDPSEANAPLQIEPWREYQVDLDRLFGPYEKWHRFSLTVESRLAAATVPNPWFGAEPTGFAAVLSPPSVPPLYFPTQAEKIAPVAAIAAVPEYAWRDLAWREVSYFAAWLIALALTTALAVRAYLALLQWSLRPRAPRWLHHGMSLCEATVGRVDHELRATFAGFLHVAQLFVDAATIAIAAALTLVIREYRRLRIACTRARLLATIEQCRAFTSAVRVAAGLWWSSSWTWRLRMTRAAAIQAWSAARRSLRYLGRPLVALYDASWTRRGRWATWTLRVVATWTAMFVVAVPAVPMQTLAADLYWDSDAIAGGNNSSTGAGLGGSGTWNTSSAMWWDLTNDGTWTNANFDKAIFYGSAGTVTLGTPVSAGAIQFKTSFYEIAGTSANPLTLGAANTIDVTGVTDLISAVVAGTDGVTVTGAGGVLRMSGINTFSGGVTVNSGILRINNDANLGMLSNSVTLGGGTLQATNTYSARSVNVSSSSSIDVASGFTTTLNGPLSGSANLTKTGNGTLSLIGSSGNTFAGNLIVAAGGGTLQVGGTTLATGAAQQGFTAPSMTSSNSISVNIGGTFKIEDNATASAAGFVADRFGSSGNRPSVALAGGTFTLNGASNSGVMTQTFGGLTLNPGGASTVNVVRNTTGTPELIFGGLTRNSGGFVNFTGTSLGTGTNDSRILFGTAPTSVGGGGATGSTTMSIVPGARSGNDLVYYDATNGIRALVAGEYNITNNPNTAGSSANVKFTAAPTVLSGPATINSLVNTIAATTTYAMGNALTITSGQFIHTPNNTLNISTGTITAGTGSGTTDLDASIIQSTVTFTANLNNNGASGVVALVKNGAGGLTFANTTNNTFSGGTYVNEGTVTTGATAGVRYLGTGAVNVYNSQLTLGSTGSTSFATANLAAFTATNGAQISIANANYSTTGDTFNIGAGSVLAGTATVTAGNGVNSITRVSNLTGIAAGQAVLARGSIVAFGGTLVAGLGAGNLTLKTGAGTGADLYFGLGANSAASSTITVGTNTPWMGLSTDRSARNFLSGTITANSDFNLQGLMVPGSNGVLLTMASTGSVAIAAPNGNVNANIIGPVTWTTASTGIGSGANKNVTFQVTPGATFTLTPAAALTPTAGGTVFVNVQEGGTLAVGNAAALNATTTIQGGGVLSANQATGLTGTGPLTINTGAIVDIKTAALGFSNTQAAGATINSGVVFRLNVASIGAAATPLDSIVGSKSPIYEIFAAANWFVNPTAAGTTIATLNRDAAGVGGMITNDGTTRSITAVANGVITVGANGGTIAATSGTTLTLPQAIALGGNTLTIGSTQSVENNPKLGTVALGAAGLTGSAGSAVSVTPGATLTLGAANQIPALSRLTVGAGSAVNYASLAQSVESLTGSGTITNTGTSVAITLNTTTSDAVFSGTLSATSPANLSLVKNGAGKQTLSGNNAFTGGVTINAGTLRLGSGGALNSTTPNAVSFGASSSGTLQLGGNGTTVAGLDSNAAIGTPIVENANAAAATLTVNKTSGTSTFAGTLRDGTGDGALSVAKSGAGALTLSGTNSYTGTTAVNAGTMNVTGSILNTTGVTVAGGATLDFTAGSTINSLTSLSSLNLGTVASTANLGLKLGSTYDSLQSTGAATTAGTIRLNLAGAAGFGAGTYTLLAAASGLDTGATYQFAGLGAGLTAGYTFSSSIDDTHVQLIATAAGSDFYWTNSQADNKWSTISNTFNSNWSTDPLGANNANATPGVGSTVYLSSAAGTVATPTNTMTLDGAFTIGALQILAPTNGVTTINLNPGAAGNLTLGSVAGITVNTGGPTSVNIAAPITLGASQSWTVTDSGGTLAVSGGIGETGGARGITKDGAGVLALNASNTFTGGLTINTGIVRLGNAGALNSTTPNAVTFGANSTGVLQLNAMSVSISGLDTNASVGTPIVENGTTGTATLTYNGASGSSTFAGVLRNGAAGTLALTKTGAGTLALGGTNLYTGTTTLAGGTLITQSAQALGTSAAPLSITTNATAPVLDLQQNATVYNTALTGTANAAILVDALTTQISAAYSLGTLALPGSTLNVSAGSNVTGTNPNSASLSFGSTTLSVGTSTINVGVNTTLTLGAVTGNFTLAKTGAGTLTLNTSGGSRNAGNTLSGGTLILGSTAALGAATSTMNLSGSSILDLKTDTSVNAYLTTVSGATTILSDKATAASAGITHTLGTLSINGSQLNVTSGGNVAAGGTAGVTFGATTLTGSPTFNITNTNGTTSTLTVAAVTLAGNNIAITGNGNFTATGIVASTGAANITLNSGFTGTATFSGTNTFGSVGGGTFVVKSGTAVANNASGYGNAAVVINLGDTGGTSNASVLANSFTIANPISVVNGSSSNTLTLGNNGATTAAVFSGAITLANNLTVTTAGTSGSTTLSNTGAGITGTGNLILNAINTTAGTGITLSATTINNAGTITNSGATGAGATVISGGLGSAVVSVNQNSAVSALTLSGANTAFNGAVNLQTGTLKLGSATALGGNGTTTGTGGTLTIGGGTVLDSTAANLVLSTVNAQVWNGSGFTFAGSNALTMGTGGVTFGTSGGAYTITTTASTLTESGLIADNGGTSLIKAGAGTLALTNTGNTFAGSVTINAGVLSLGSLADGGAGSNGTGAITFNNGSTAAQLTYTGTGATLAARGLTLSGSTGGVTLDSSGSGALAINGTNTVGITGNTTLTLQGSYTGANSIGSSLTDNGGSILSLVKTGAGSWTLSAANTFSGNTTVNAGALQLANVNALQNSALNVTGGTLQLRADDDDVFATKAATVVTLGSVTIDANQITSGNNNNTLSLGTAAGVSIGANTLNVTGGNGYAVSLGAVTLTGNPTFNPTTGILQIASITGTARNVVLDGTSTGNNTVGAIATTTGTLTKSNSGTWTLNGTNSYAGGTTISGGTLNAAAVNALGASVSTNILTMTGASATLNVTANQNVNSASINASSAPGLNVTAGTLNILGSNSGGLFIGDTTGGATGIVTISGTGGITVNGASGVIFAKGASSSAINGTLNLGNGSLGGTLTAQKISMVNAANSTGTINFNGGKLQASASNTAFLTGLTAVNIQTGGAVIDSNGFSITVNQALLHDSNLGATPDGGLTIAGGSGLVTLKGTHTYTGPTSVSTGNLALSSGSLGGSGVTVESGRTLSILGNYSVTATDGITVKGGATLSMADTALRTLTLSSGTPNSTVLTLGDVSTAAVLNFDIGGTTPDKIVLGNGLFAQLNAGGATVNLSLAGGLSNTNGTPLTLISAPGGGLLDFAHGGSNLNSLGLFTLGTTTIGGATLSLSTTDTALLLTITGAPPPPSIAYFRGADPYWNSFTGGSLNWATDATGATATANLPGTADGVSTNVHFYAAGAAGTNLDTVLGQNFTIQSLTLDGGTGFAADVGIDGTIAGSSSLNSLTITPLSSADGIDVNSGAGALTITAPVVLGADQTWANMSANTITINGGVAGNANLTLQTAAGGGNITIANAQLNNSGSIVSSGAGGTLTISGGVGSNVRSVTNTGGAALTINNLPLTVNTNGTTSLINNGGGVFTVANGINGVGNLVIKANSTGTFTLGTGAISNIGSITNSGSGSGGVAISGVIGSNVTTVTQNAAGSILTLNGANTFAGGLTIRAGTVQAGSGTSAAPTAPASFIGNSTVTVNLGGTTGVAAALLSNGTTISPNFANPIALASTGILTLGTSSNATTGTTQFSGGVTGGNAGGLTLLHQGTTGGLTISGTTGLAYTGPLAIINSATGAGAGAVTVSATNGITSSVGNVTLTTNSTGGISLQGPVNNTGTITTAVGTGAGVTTISGAIGSTVTNLIHNSTNSQLSITNANPNFSSLTTINAGSLVLSGSGTLGSSNVTVSGTLSSQASATVATTGNVTINGGGVLSLLSGTVNTMTIGGNLTLGGATAGILSLELNSAGAADKVIVNGSTGVSFGGVGGATVIPSVIGSLAALSDYTLLTVNGSGGGVTVGPGGFSFGGGATQLILGGTTQLSLSSPDGKSLHLIVDSVGAAPDNLYWRGTFDNAWTTISGSNTNWNTGVSNGTVAAAVPGPATTVHFYANSAANLTTNLGQNFAVNALLSDSGTSTVTINGTINGSANLNTLTIAPATSTDGIKLQNSNSGAMTINAPLSIGASQTWTNASTNLLTVTGGVGGTGNLVLNNNNATALGITISTGGINQTGSITNSGTGTGTVLISSVIGSNVTGVVQNSTTSSLVLSGANTFTGTNALTVLAGAVRGGNGTTAANTFFGGGTINLGGTAGVAASVLSAGTTISPNFANPIVLANTGILTIGTHTTATTGTTQFSGGVTGGNAGGLTLLHQGTTGGLTISGTTGLAYTGPLAIINSATGAGAVTVSATNGITSSVGNVTLTTNSTGGISLQGPVNNTGSVTTAVGTGAGLTTISGAIGSTVTNLIHNSTNSQLSITNANPNFSSLTTINAGSLALSGSGTLGTSAVTVAGGTLAVQSNNVAGAVGGNLTLNGGGTLSLLTTGFNTFNITGGMTLGAVSGASLINLEIGTGANSNDKIAVGGIVSFANGGGTIVPSLLTALVQGTDANRSYLLLTAAGGITTGAGGFNFGSGATTITLAGAQLSFDGSDATHLYLKVNSIDDAPSELYWRGSIDNTWTSLTGSNTNWNTGISSGTNAQTVPGDKTDVHFYANGVTTNPVTTTLGQNFEINGLVLDSGSNPVNINGAIAGSTSVNTLTIAPSSLTNSVDGIKMSGTSGALSISAPLILGNSQTWTNSSGNLLTVSGGMTTTGNLIVNSNAAGGVTFSTANATLAGNLTLNANSAGNIAFTTADLLGTGNVVLNANSTGTIAFNTSGNQINNSGTITNSGLGTATTTILKIGANVTGITQASDSSPLTLSSSTGTGFALNAAGTTLTSIGAALFTIQSAPSGGNLTINDNGAGNITLSGAYSGTGTLAVNTNGSGTVLVSGASSNSGNQFFTSNGSGNIVVTGASTATGNLVLNANSTGNISIASFVPGGTGFSVTNSGSGTGNVAIFGAIGANATGGVIQNSSSSTLTLSGASVYNGPTVVSAGTLALSAGGSLGGNTAPATSGTAVSVASGATLAVRNGNSSIGLSTTSGSSVTVAGGGALSLVDGTANKLTINNSGTGTVLTLGGASTPAQLNFEIGAAADQIVLGSGLKALINAGGVTLNISAYGALTAGSFPLITSPGGGLLNTNGTTGGLNLYTLAGNFGGATLTLDDVNNPSTDNVLMLTVTLNNPITTAYFTGAQDALWNTFSGGSDNNSNWAKGDGTDTHVLPGSTTDVHFYKSGAATENLATSLGQNFTIAGLTMDGGPLSQNVSIASGGGILTINPANSTSGDTTTGILLNSGAGSLTISAPIVLGAGQTWTNNSSSQLKVTGGVSGPFAITTTGTGTGGLLISSVIDTDVTGIVQNSATSPLTLSAINTFTGPVSVQAGTLIGMASNNAFGVSTNVVTLGNATGSNAASLLIGSNGLSIANPITLGATDGALTLGTTATGISGTFAGAITGSHDLIINTPAAVTLAANNSTFTGDVTVKRGSLIGTVSANAFGSGNTITLGDDSGTNAASLLVGTTGLTIVNPIVLGGTGGALTIGNSGTAISTTFSGGVTGDNDLTISASATTGTVAVSNAVNNQGTVTNAGTGSGSVTISGNIGSNVTGVVQNSGTSALVLSGAGNAFTGGLTINAGTVSVAADANLGNAANGITFNGNGGLTLSANGTFARSIAINNAATAAITISTTSGTNTISGQVTGTGGLTLVPTATAATLTLSAANNDFRGPLRVATAAVAATVNVSSLADGSQANGNIQLGGTTGAGTFIWGTGAGAALTLNNRRIELTGTTGGGVLDNSNATAANAFVINTNLLVTGTGAKTLTLQGANLGANAFAGSIADGTGSVISVTKTGAGNWILGGANSYTGQTQILGGSLSVSSLNSVAGGTPTLASSSLGAPTTSGTGTIVFGATTTPATLIYTGTGETTDRIISLAGTTGGGVIDQSGTGLLKFTSNFATPGAGIKTFTLQGSTAGTGEFAGTIVNNSGTNTTSLVKAGTGMWTVSGANTFTGTTAIQNGTLSVSSLNKVVGGTTTSSLGAPITPANGTIALGATTTTGTLLYTGAGEVGSPGTELEFAL